MILALPPNPFIDLILAIAVMLTMLIAILILMYWILFKR